ncbi:cytochrome-c oxidase, cbb3-type subunit I [Prosthecobacter vanneervenii]|uniref:cytochrome-c oxidase n=1 Tax=Prosthecobacter vanneervenii TaxID=48466 RepID=A0A7W7Y9J2_9BACT|nr:cytochrome-c oxidase, cbb3-type subunit I [Prosthecobacter vanneervenii]MBB5032019.1 cytochrome c oxidase cbb3-type subunit I/II [Prosthecobacter vanneervenii]
MTTNATKITIEFDDRTVRRFMIASIIWGIVGMLAGVFVASQLNFHQLNLASWLSFGRLRPLHTNAVIFAFVGNMMFAGVYYSTQRLCKARMASDLLSNIHFWGWQLIIVSAAITLPLGLTRGQEYAELIWPINIAVALIWVVFAVNFFWTLAKRNEPSLYVALWFYISTVITIALLYIVNHLSIPTSWTHSYTIFAGVQNGLVQWWYGHNAVAFFLTTPILGIMYYFLPKAVERPVYSYRLSIVHFWSLVFIYIWAGPHHLLNTALPKWLQMLGMFFSLMLWAPSWGGMLNGLLTLRGAWDKLRTDPVVKFFIAAVTFYGMSTFEGPLLSIRAVNALSHYSDWTIGHVHSGAMGWNGFMAAGLFYWLTPRLYGTKLYSTSMANFHFWIGLIGILVYVGAMWVSGIMQGLMLNATTPDGHALVYPNFIETLTAIRPMMAFRIIGGSLYLVGMIIMAVNIWLTIRKGSPVNEKREVAVIERNQRDTMGLKETFFNDPIACTFAGLVLILGWLFLPPGADIASLGCALVFGVLAVKRFQGGHHRWSAWYDSLLNNWLPFTVLTFVAVALGGLIQIVPTVLVNRATNVEDRIQQPYTPLELAGRDIYVSEGCYNCHSQMIRTMLPDVLRYGDYSRLGESIYDHPYQWGSKRTGPDLAREGGKYPHSWHYDHMKDPRAISVGSNMPAYPHLFTEKFDQGTLWKKVGVLTQLGVPYPAMTETEVKTKAVEQGIKIVQELEAQSRAGAMPDSKIVALIAYLQKLGKYDAVDPEQKPLAKPEGVPFPLKPGIPDGYRTSAVTK